MPKKNGAKKPAQKQSAKSNPVDQALTIVAKKFIKAGGTKLLLKVFPYLLFGYFGNKMAYAYRVTDAPDFFNKLMGSLSNLGPAFEHILPSFHLMDLLFGAIFGAGMRLVVYMKGKNAKKFRKGEEYGSARWGNAKDIEPYMDLENPENNVILTQTEGLIMNGKPKGPKYARNKNILVIGGSGSGKTRFFVKPNLMQLHSSYVVTDPKRSVVKETARRIINEVLELISRIRQMWGRMPVPDSGAKYALMMKDRTDLASVRNAEKFVADSGISTFSELRDYYYAHSRTEKQLKERMQELRDRKSYLERLSRAYSEYAPLRDVMKERDQLSALARIRFDKEHRDKIERFPKADEALHSLMDENTRITPKAWARQIGRI